MNNSINILIIDNSIVPTGAFKSIHLITQYLPKNNFVFALPRRSILINGLQAEGTSVYTFPFIELSRSLRSVFYLPMLLWNSMVLLRLIKKEKISIVHVNDMYNLCGVFVKMLRPRLKLIYHIRLLPDSYIHHIYKPLRNLIFYFSDSIICNSKAALKGFNKHSSKIAVVYNPIDLAERMPAKEHVQSEPVRLVYLANYFSGKGQEYALEALVIARKVNPALRLIFAGGTFSIKNSINFKHQLQNQAENLLLSDIVEFRDFEHDIEQIIKSADIMLQFSDSESFSRTCLEALYYGTPMIATDSGGPAELILNGKTGILVPVADITAMANSIIELSNNLEAKRRLSEAGRTFVTRNFNPNQIALQVDELYQKLANS